MSTELDQYLKSQPIHIFKLIDGSSIIGRLDENDETGVIISKPHELVLIENGERCDIAMNEWLFGCDAEEVMVTYDKILAYSEASLSMKNFYSKAIMRQKISALFELHGKNQMKKKSPGSIADELFQSFFNDLDSKDTYKSKEEEQRRRRWNWPDELL